MASPKDVIFFGATTGASIFDYKSLILFQFLIL